MVLNWITSTELNNNGFKIERKEPRLDRDWKTIGFVKGKGTITTPQLYNFIDKNLKYGKYVYRLKQIDFNGSFEYCNELYVEIFLPKEFQLLQNYPNPFNPETSIDYIIPEETFVDISLFDVTGRKIKELVNEKKDKGYYSIVLKGNELSSGIYFYRMSTTSGYSVVKKLMVLK